MARVTAPCAQAGPVVRRVRIAAIALPLDGEEAIFSDSCTHTLNRLALSNGAITTLAGAEGQAGSSDGSTTTARFNRPLGLAISPDGTELAVVDNGNAAVRILNLADGQVSTLARLGPATVAIGLQQAPELTGIAYGPEYLVVSDEANHTLSGVLLENGKVRFLAGANGQPGFEDGLGAEAQFNGPAGLASSPAGFELLITDTGNNAIRGVGFLPRLDSRSQVFMPLLITN